MNNKRSINTTSPDYTVTNAPKKILTTGNMQAANQNSTHDVFSWEKLCTLLDNKLKDVTRKSDLNELKHEIDDIKEENKKLKCEMNKLTARMEFIDRRSRSANVIVSGLNSGINFTSKNDFEMLCANVLKVKVNVISSRKLAAGNSYCFTLESSLQANNVLAAKRNLKGQRIYINKDYTEVEQNIRYQLRNLSKNLTRANKTLKVRLGEFCIFIDNNKFTWANGKIIASSNNNAEFLRKILLGFNYSAEVCVRGAQQLSEDKVPTPIIQ